MNDTTCPSENVIIARVEKLLSKLPTWSAQARVMAYIQAKMFETQVDSSLSIKPATARNHDVPAN